MNERKNSSMTCVGAIEDDKSFAWAFSRLTEKTVNSVLPAGRRDDLMEVVRRPRDTTAQAEVTIAGETPPRENALQLRSALAAEDLSLARNGSFGWLQQLFTDSSKLKVIRPGNYSGPPCL